MNSRDGKFQRLDCRYIGVCLQEFSWSNSQIPECTCSTSHNAPFRKKHAYFCSEWNTVDMQQVNSEICEIGLSNLAQQWCRYNGFAYYLKRWWHSCLTYIVCLTGISYFPIPSGNWEIGYPSQTQFQSKSRKIFHGPTTRYAKWQVAYAPGMPGTFSLPPQVSDLDIHQLSHVMHAGIAT